MKELVYIVFIWLIAMIAYNIWKWRKEKKRIRKQFFKNPLTMTIGERVKKNKKRW